MKSLINKFFRNPKGSLIISILSFCFCSSQSKAQIVVNKNKGCIPFEVEFKHNFGNVTNPKWDFGDESFSEIDFPNHTYVKKGSFTVIFTADGGVSDQITISALGVPTSDFVVTTPSKGCKPLNVSFQNKSVGDGGAEIKSVQWDFGDGGINSEENPSYQYTLNGIFEVSLLVTDENGCSSSKKVPNLIVVSEPPSVSFTTDPSPPSGCTPPLKVTFKSTSKSNSPSSKTLQYFWDFGNGETSNVASSPATTYNALGTYSAKLKVIDDVGCVDSSSKAVNVLNPIASFEIKDAISDTVCSAVTFINTSQGGTVTHIDFGDGGNGKFNTKNEANHIFKPGTYTVKVTTVNGSCSDEVSKQIVILPIEVDFTADPIYSCSFPLDVQYSDLSEGAVTWKWVFSGVGVETVQNPLVTYDVEETDSFRHYLNSGSFGATLTITNRFGCTETKQKNLVEYKIPTARFMPDKVFGCVPLTVNFSDSSSSFEPIANWKWEFGDGTVVDGAADNASHTYTTPGDYYARLIITNSAGCIDTSYMVHIRVGDKITPNFDIVPAEICLGESFQIKNLTALPNNIDQIHYQIGNNHPVACPSEGIVDYTPDTLAGSYDIKMQVGWNGCFSEITKPAVIKIKGPSAEFKANFDCSKPMEWIFTIQQSESDTWDIDFGDGTVITGSTDLSFTHTYTTSDDYIVKLKAYGSSGCDPSEFQGVVHVRDLKAVITTDSLGCTRVPHKFDASNSTGVGSLGKADGFIWDWGDGTQHIRTAATTYTHTYETGGPKVVRLIVKDINGCYDTTETTIQIKDVSGDFEIAGKQPGCIPGLEIKFSDKTIADTTLVKWSWDFGDETTSTEVSPTHIYNVYPKNGKNFFNVKLNLTDTLGCKGDVTKQVQISRPDAFLSADNYKGCTGTNVNFTAKIPNHNKYTWTFGDGVVLDTTASKVAHIYKNSGEFIVSLSVVDTVGCIADSVMTQKIKIQKTPEARFVSTADSLAVLCYPVQVTFVDSSIVENFKSREWDLNLDDPNDPTVSLPVVGKNYDKPGIYRVSLTIKTTYGCTSVAYDTIEVVGPSADFDFTPNLICKGQSVKFSIKDTSDIFTYKWDFGDGLEAGAISPIDHQFNFHPPNGKAVVSLIYWSKDSICKSSTSHEIDVHRVIADFKRNNELTKADTAHCWGITDLFTNLSVTANSWSWNFGDGTTFEGETPPTHLYQNPGTFNVSLSISDTVTGCVDTVVKPMIIFPKVNASVQGGIACEGDSIQLLANGGTTYSWSPASYLTNPAIANPKAFPPTTTIYTLTAGNEFGCSDTKTVMAEIIEKSESTTTTINELIIGEDTTINVYQGKYHYYQWVPFNPPWISCATCSNPTFKPLENITYTVTITDSLGCFTVPKTYVFIPQKEASVDVPNTFTPNGDGVNDLIHVRGWGIEKLLEFKIYNRWGQLVYNSDNINEGWDGKFRGEPQDIDAYVFYVKVKNYINTEPKELQGYINLVR